MIQDGQGCARAWQAVLSGLLAEQAGTPTGNGGITVKQRGGVTMCSE